MIKPNTNLWVKNACFHDRDAADGKVIRKEMIRTFLSIESAPGELKEVIPSLSIFTGQFCVML